MENKYDSLVGEIKAPVAPQENIATVPEQPAMDYVSVLDQDKQDLRQQLQSSIYQAAPKNPDQFANVLKLSEQSGFSTRLVADNYDEVQKKAIRQNTKYDDLIDQTPGLARWLARPDNSAVAHDDIDGLSQVESEIKNHGVMTDIFNGLASTVLNIGAGISKVPALVSDASQAFSGDLGGKMAPGSLNVTPTFEGQAPVKPTGTVAPPLDTTNLRNNDYAAALETEAQKYGEMVTNSKVGVVNLMKQGRTSDAVRLILVNGVASAPYTLATILTGGAALPIIAAQSAADKYDRLKDDGVETRKALSNAIPTGMIEAGTEAIPLGFAKAWEHALVPLIGKASFGELMVAATKTLLAGGATEAIEEGIGGAGQDTVDIVTGTNKNAYNDFLLNTIERMGSGFAGGVTVLGPTTYATAVRSSLAQRSETNQVRSFYKSLGDKIEATKLSKRLPQKMQEAIAEMTKDGPVENIFIPVDKFDEYFQSKNQSPLETVNKLNILEAYDEAKVTGSPVKIPTAVWAANVTPELYKGLANDVKFSHDSYTPNELKAQDQEFKAAGAQADTQAQSENEPIEDRQVYNQIVEQRTEELSQVYPPSQARDLAVTFANTQKAFAAQVGKPLAQYAVDEAIPLKITSMDAQGAGSETQTLNQDVTDKPIPEGYKFSEPQSKQVTEREDNWTEHKITVSAPVESESNRSTTTLNQSAARSQRLGRAETLGFDTSKVLYHGGPAKITEFKTNSKGANKYLEGVYMTPLKGDVQRYMDMAKNSGAAETTVYSFYAPKALLQLDSFKDVDAAIEKMGLQLPRASAKRTYKFNPEMTNLMKMRLAVEKSGVKPSKVDDILREKLSSIGYKGVTTENDQVTLVFDPKDVRSTDAEFKDGESANIYFQSAAQQNAPTFYSKLNQTVEQKMGGSASPKDIMGMLKEIKPEEIKWSGIEEFLKGKEKVTKPELLDFLRGNALEIKEVVKGGKDAGNRSATIYDVYSAKNSKANPQDWTVSFSDDKEVRVNAPDKATAEALAVKEVNDNLGGWDGLVEGAEGVPTALRYAKYVLPGGENYREVLFTLPVAEAKSLSTLSEAETQRMAELEREGEDEDGMVPAKWRELHALQDRAAGGTVTETAPTYSSSHFDEANVLAHTRLNDRTDSDGKKVLFVEEIQSDWHQEGRKKGYKGIKDESPYLLTDDKFEEIGRFKTREEAIAYRHKNESSPGTWGIDFRNNESAVPDAPFRKTWHEFVFKRLLREAVEKGYNKLAWTTGEQQADRYSLAKQVDRISAMKLPDGKYHIEAFKGNKLVQEAQTLNESGLEAAFGKDLAKKIVNGEGEDGPPLTKVYRGDDLKVGGEGMKGFYDKILVDYANKFVKKYGAKVEQLAISGGVQDNYEVQESEESGLWYITTDDGVHPRSRDYETEGSAHRALEKFRAEESTTVHSIILTPELIKAAMTEGFALFQGGNLDPRGSIDINASGTTIRLTKKADISTTLHEFGHYFFEQLRKLAPKSPTSAADIETLKGWFKARGKDAYLNDLKGIVESTEARAQKEMQYLPLALMQREAYQHALEQGPEFFEDVANSLGENTNNNEWGRFLLTPYHEQFARGYEAYYLEGKSPTQALRRIFRRFQAAILNVYRNKDTKAALDVALSDEVRAVFDRISTADAVTDQAMTDTGAKPLFADAASFGLKGEKADAYMKAVGDAAGKAKEEAVQRVMKDFKRSKEFWYDDERKKIKEEVIGEVNQSRTYKALSNLQNGTMPDGSPLPAGTQAIKLLKESLLEDYGNEITGILPKRIYENDTVGGIDYKIASAMMGYESSDAFIKDISNLPKKLDYVDSVTEQRLKAKYPDIMEALGLSELREEAEQVVISESSAALMRRELEIIASEKLPIFKEMIRKVSLIPPTEAQVRNQAAEIIGSKKWEEISPIIYKRAGAKAAKEAGVALAKGDRVATFEAKRRQLLNNELFRAATEARESIDKSRDEFIKIRKYNEKDSKARDADYVNAARAVLALYGLAKEDKTPASYLAKLKEYDNEKYQALSLLIDNTVLDPKDWRDLTYNEYQDLHDTVMALWDLAKSSNEITLGEKTMTLDETKAPLMARLVELTGDRKKPGLERDITEGDKRFRMLLGAKAALTRAANLMENIDGLTGSRDFQETFIFPVREATNQYRKQKQIVLKGVLELMRGHMKGQSKKEIVSPELGYTFSSKATLLGALQHVGNTSNLRKLLVGRSWGTVDEAGNLDTARWDAFVSRMQREGVLTKADYDFVQSLWDLNESFKSDAQKAHKALYGFYFDEITANEVVTPYGTYRGGYMPAKADPYIASDAKVREEKANAEGNTTFNWPSTGRGATKSRIDSYAAPLSLDLKLVVTHMDWALRFTYIQPTVQQLAKLNWNKELRSAMDTYDIGLAEVLNPFLERAASQKVVTSPTSEGGKALAWFFSRARSNSSLGAMTANFVNTAQQVVGFSIAGVKVSPRSMVDAFATYIRSPKETAQMVCELDPFMAHRLDNQVHNMNQEIENILLDPNVYEQAKNFVARNGFFLQSAFQNPMDITIWLAAYNEALAKGESQKSAIDLARDVVVKTQSSQSAEEVSTFETGPAQIRFFTMYQNYWNAQANLLGTEYVKTIRDLGLKAGAGRGLYIYTMGFMIPAFISWLITQAGNGVIDEDDDDSYLDDLLTGFFMSQFEYATPMIPLAGPVIKNVVSRFDDKMWNDKLSLSPAVNLIENAAGAPKSVYDAIVKEGDSRAKKKAMRDTLGVLTLFTGFPVLPLSKPFNYAMDLQSGEAEPKNALDMARGFVTGRPGK